MSGPLLHVSGYRLVAGDLVGLDLSYHSSVILGRHGVGGARIVAGIRMYLAPT